MDSKICDTCTAIPFDELPHEEDEAYPHKQGLSDLEESSKVCKLCKLILSAIKYAQGDFDLESYDIADTIRPKMNDYDTAHSKDLSPAASKKFGVHQAILRLPGTEISHIILRSRSVHTGQETELGPGGPRDLSAAITRMDMQKDPLNRVWLYGNWWTLLGFNQCTPQLIGFGARLTRNPSLRISDVNGERRSILFRGSDIRVFTEYGTTIYFYLTQSSYFGQMVR